MRIRLKISTIQSIIRTATVNLATKPPRLPFVVTHRHCAAANLSFKDNNYLTTTMHKQKVKSTKSKATITATINAAHTSGITIKHATGLFHATARHVSSAARHGGVVIMCYHLTV